MFIYTDDKSNYTISRNNVLTILHIFYTVTDLFHSILLYWWLHLDPGGRVWLHPQQASGYLVTWSQRSQRSQRSDGTSYMNCTCCTAGKQSLHVGINPWFTFLFKNQISQLSKVWELQQLWSTPAPTMHNDVRFNAGPRVDATASFWFRSPSLLLLIILIRLHHTSSV